MLLAMKSWSTLAILALLAILVGEIWYLRGHRRTTVGAPAPPVSLEDTEGRRVSLDGLKGRVVALNFWATWCGPCQQEIPDLASVYSANRGKCFQLLGVTEESAREEVLAVARKLGVNYPVLLDGDGKVGDAYKIAGYPRTVLIDVKGRVRRVFEGPVGRAEFERALLPLLAEAPESCPGA